MKKIFAFIILTFVMYSGQSQLTQGSWIVGGSASLYSTKSNYRTPAFQQKSEDFNLSITPYIGYFLEDKFAIGLSPSFSWGKSKGGDATDPNGVIVGSGGSSNIKRFLIGPFARYYLLSTDNPFNIQVETAYQYGTYSSKPIRGKVHNFSVGAGPVIYFNSSVGLEFKLGYSFRSEDVKGSYKTTEKGLQMGIGFQIHLEKE